MIYTTTNAAPLAEVATSLARWRGYTVLIEQRLAYELRSSRERADVPQFLLAKRLGRVQSFIASPDTHTPLRQQRVCELMQRHPGELLSSIIEQPSAGHTGGRYVRSQTEAQMMTASNHSRDDGAIDVIERVEVQRRQLRRAVSVLACARFALTYSDWIEDEPGIDCADVPAVACSHAEKLELEQSRLKTARGAS